MWNGYHTKRWGHLREKILRRDGYMSVEARRYGRNENANVVHHCWPAEEWPEYAWAPWNLISITEKEHRTFHNADGSLTPLGEAVRRRHTPPPVAPR